MPHFPVDAGFHAHTKRWSCSLSAVGLWTVAGAWSVDQLTDGFIPNHMLRSLGGSTKLANELVSAGLWFKDGNKGYRFHQWEGDKKGQRNLKASSVEAILDAKSVGAKLSNHRRWHLARKIVDPNCEHCQSSVGDQTSDQYSESLSDQTPIGEPNQLGIGSESYDYKNKNKTKNKEVGSYVTREGYVPNAHSDEPPPPRCQRHLNDPDAPACRACGDARRARQQWDADQLDASKAATSLNAKRSAEVRALAITNCTLCDDEGYLGTRLCDHVDRSEAASRGSAAVRAALAKKAGGDAA